jgi:RNA polymerase sigma-70 factor (ECF subfamily)
MTLGAGRFSQNFCGSHTYQRRRRCCLTHRQAYDRKGSQTIGCRTTDKNLEMAMIDRRESVAAPEEPPDRELMERISKGDALAFTEFYNRHSVLLFSIAAKVVGDLQEAQELLQDCARLVWERAPLYDPKLGKPLSWAVVLTRNKAIDRLRILQRESEAIAKITERFAADYSTHSGKPPSEATENENDTFLRQALTSLPAEQRMAIELAFFAGLSQTQVAAQLGQPLGTVKARIRRGMLAMREALEEHL